MTGKLLRYIVIIEREDTYHVCDEAKWLDRSNMWQYVLW